MPWYYFLHNTGPERSTVQHILPSALKATPHGSPAGWPGRGRKRRSRRRTVADVNRCPVAGNLVEFLIDFCLCNGVKGRSWFIQNDERGILIGTCFCLSWLLLHLINQSKYSSLLILGQPWPFFKQLLLRCSQRDRSIFFREQLGKRNPKRITDFFEWGNGGNHVLTIPRRNRRLR